MPAYARSQIVVEDQVGVYHCIARCVRRAFLCGVDPYTGQDYSHRKEWILDRMRELAGLFAIEVCDYSVMSNHLHLVLRIRPDLAGQWSDDEIALRWCRVFPPRDEATGEPVEPGEHDLAMITADSEKLAERRKRLASLSWFMRCLCENIARAANDEDGSSGRFWAGRFKSVALLDEAAILACSVYVDLNPVRAGLATTPEEYVMLLDWTGRELRADKRGAIPDHLAPIMERLGLNRSNWVETVRGFGRLFKQAAGRSSSLVDAAARRSRRWFQGKAAARTAFV